MAKGKISLRHRRSNRQKHVPQSTDTNPSSSLESFPPPFQISPQTITAIERLRASGETGQIGKIVDGLAHAWAKSYKSQLGIARGRPRKHVTNTTGMLCAAKVEAWLAVFHPAMGKKRELQKKYRNLSLVKEELTKSGYDSEIAEIVISNSTPFQAACALVGASAEPRRSPDTIANYSRRYRSSVWRYVPNSEGDPEAPKPNGVVRFFIDLADAHPIPIVGAYTPKG